MQSINTNVMFLWLIYILFTTQHVRSRTQLTQVQRASDTNTILFTNPCVGKCIQIGAYQMSGACECRCQYGSVFQINAGKCATISRGNAFLISDAFNPTSRQSTLTADQLLSGVHIQYCESVCTKQVGSCHINRYGSVIDQSKIIPMWNSDEKMDFVIIKNENRNQLKLRNFTTKFNGLLVTLSIECITPTAALIKTTALFQVEGTFKIPQHKTTSATRARTTIKSTIAPRKTTPSSIFTSSSKKFTKTTDAITINNTAMTTISSLTTKLINMITNSNTNGNVSEPTSSSHLTSNSFTNSTNSLPTTFTKINTTNTPAYVSSRSTINIVSNKSNPAIQSQRKGSNDDNMLMIIAVPIVFSVLLSLCCLICLVFWRRRKKQLSRKKPSKPVSLFQNTTPVFLVDRETVRISKQLESPFAMINDPLYEFPPYEKKSGTVRHLYAQIDKFLKKKKNSNFDNSFDDGYITDDNYDYKRFAAFPSDLYSFPGSILSLNEPDYRIPEDIEDRTVHLHQLNPPPYSSYQYATGSQYQHRNNHFKSNPKHQLLNNKEQVFNLYSSNNEDPYERPDLGLIISNRKPLDKIWQMQEDKNVFVAGNNRNLAISDSDEPQYDKVADVFKNNRNSSVESIYDDPAEVIENKQIIDSLYSKPNKKKKSIKKLTNKINKEDLLYSKHEDAESLGDETTI